MRDRKRVHEQGRGRERIPNGFWAIEQSSTWGSNSRTMRSWPELKSKVGGLTHWATQVPPCSLPSYCSYRLLWDTVMVGRGRKGCKDREQPVFHVRCEKERKQKRNKERKEKEGNCESWHSIRPINKMPSRTDCIKGISQVKQSPNCQGCERDQKPRKEAVPLQCFQL